MAVWIFVYRCEIRVLSIRRPNQLSDATVKSKPLRAPSIRMSMSPSWSPRRSVANNCNFVSYNYHE